MKNVRSLGLRVKQLRAQAGISQQKLADLAYVSRKWLVDFENGKPTVEASKVFDVLQILGFEVELQPIKKHPEMSSEVSDANARA